MKKSIIALVLVFLVSGLLFAATGDKLFLITEVKKVKPEFVIYGKRNVAAASDVKGTLAEYVEAGTNVIKSDDDPSVKDITLIITLKHVGEGRSKIRYKNTTGVELTVKATELKNITTNVAEDKTNPPTVSVFSTQTITNFTLTKESESSGQVGLKAKYESWKSMDNTDSEQEIGSWTYTWAQKEDLPPGTYQATITLTYTVSD